MKNQLQIFNYGEKEVRTIQQNGEIWWVLKDVCDVLGIANATDVAKRLDEDEVTRFNLGGLSGETNIINESGLYNVILRSDKPKAKDFKRWVTHEILPSIRKHGAYMTPATIENVMNDPDSWIQLLTALKDERTQKEQLQIEAEQNKPKLEFANAIMASDDTISIGVLAKTLCKLGMKTGQNRLFDELRDDGFLINRGGINHNVPSQICVEKGYLTFKETLIATYSGETKIKITPLVTPQGQDYFIKYFTKKHNLNKNT